MKLTKFASVFTLCFFIATCYAGVATQESPKSTNQRTQSTSMTSFSGAASTQVKLTNASDAGRSTIPLLASHEKGGKPFAHIPAGVDIYATTDAGGGQKCVVGAKVDEDGMNERPVAYLSNPSGSLAWIAFLQMPAAAYQGRATHCAVSTAALFVLVQSDTQPQQSLSQTFLQVVKLDRKNGSVFSFKNIVVPNVSVAYTAWVEKGGKNFILHGNKLVVKGEYDLLSSKDNPNGAVPSAFSVEIPQGFNP